MASEKLPTRIYTYGLLPPKSGKDAFDKMLRNSVHYYNALLEIERWKLDESARFWAKRGGYLPLLEKIKNLEDTARKADKESRPALYLQIRELESEFNILRESAIQNSLPKEEARRRIRSREIKDEYKKKKVVLSSSALDSILDSESDCVSPRRKLQIELASEAKARGVLPSGKLLNKRLKEANLEKITQYIDDQASLDAERARTFYGMYYGTYQYIHAAVEQAIKTSETFPSFKRWEGEGRVGAPVDTNSGLSVDSILNCKYESGVWSDSGNFVLQIQNVPDEIWEQKNSRAHGSISQPNTSWSQKTRTSMRICIDSLGRSGKNRVPVWVEFPLVMHRPLPKHGKIVGAWISVYKRGSKTRYELQMQIQDESHLVPKKPHGDGTIAFNFGYRASGRVAFALDDSNASQEMLVDSKVEQKLDLADHRRQIREKAANYMRDSLFRWSEKFGFPDSFLRNEGKMLVIPHWSGDQSRSRSIKERSLKKKIELLVHSNESSLSDKLQRIYGEWRYVVAINNIFSSVGLVDVLLRPADLEIFEELSVWSLDDKSLFSIEAGSRFKSRLMRKNQIHIWAHKICDENSVVLIENTNYAKIKKNAKEKRGDMSVGLVTSISRRRDAYAPGDTRRIIEEVAKARGLIVKKVNSADLTRIHHACGHDGPWDASPSIEHVCEKCNVKFDQDKNFCEGLIIRSKS